MSHNLLPIDLLITLLFIIIKGQTNGLDIIGKGGRFVQSDQRDVVLENVGFVVVLVEDDLVDGEVGGLVTVVGAEAVVLDAQGVFAEANGVSGIRN